MKQREVNFSSLVFILTSPPADALHCSHGLFRPPWLPVALSALQEWEVWITWSFGNICQILYFLLSKIDSAHIFSSMQQRDGDTAVSFQNAAAARLTSQQRSDQPDGQTVQHLTTVLPPGAKLTAKM